MSKNWIEKLEKQDACRPGILWASQYKSPQEAWNACEDAEWMLWAWGRNCGQRGSESHRMLVLACVKIARTSLKYIEDKEYKEIYKTCLNTTEKWAKREDGVTLADVKKILSDAYDIFHYFLLDSCSDGVYYAACAASDTSYGSDTANVIIENDEKRSKKFANMIRKIQSECPRFGRGTG